MTSTFFSAAVRISILRFQSHITINHDDGQRTPPQQNRSIKAQTKPLPIMAATTIEAAAQQLLQPAGEFDVSLLDQVVTAAYNPADPNRAMANKALMALQESPDVWTKADAILERAQNPQSRFFGLQVLDDAIRTR
jgi:hypothetical protein